MHTYTQIASAHTSEYIIEKSKFIGNIHPAQSMEEAQAFIHTMKKKYWDATHNCTALCLGANQENQRCNDDGEPSGTAGKPMLEAFKTKGITNGVLVVTRYFGGIKLGAGGLIRAYSHIAHLTLEEAPKELITPKQVVQVILPYTHYNAVEIYLKEHNIHNESTFTEHVTLTLYVEPALTQALQESLTNLICGTLQWSMGDIISVALPI